MLQPPAFPKGTAPGLAGTLQEASRAHEAMDKCVSNLEKLVRDFGMAANHYRSRVTALLAQGAARPDATTFSELQRLQAQFNLQYLELQSKMQMENRTYLSVSNVLKTRHDTAKNSISNVR